MLKWFEEDSVHYWIVAWTSFSILGLVALTPTIAGIFSAKIEQWCLKYLPAWLYVGLAAFNLSAFRWPIWRVGEELNPDESQLIAGAITLQYDPIYWRAVDGTTHGPLDAYPLFMAHRLGVPLDYFGARTLGTALMFILFYSCYRVLATYSRESIARVTVFPLFCFLAFSSCWDLVHYSSEHVPATLLGLGLWLLASELSQRDERRAWSPRWFLGSLALGAVPFAKLQGGPIALSLLISVGVFDLCLAGVALRTKIRRLVVLVGSALLTTAFFALVTWWSGTWIDAWKSYIIQNIRYSSDKHHSILELLDGFWDYARLGEGFYIFTVGCSVVATLSAFRALSAPGRSLRLVALCAIFLIFSLIAVVAPGRLYAHYLLFLAAPVCLIAASLWQGCWDTIPPETGKRAERCVLLLVFFSAAIGPQIKERIYSHHPYVDRLGSFGPLIDNPVAKEILRYAKPNEHLAIWGWMSRFHVYTGMPQATRESHTVQQIQSSPQISYFRNRYMADIKRSSPPVFVDAVGPGNFVFQDRALAHESFEELREFISSYYRQVAEINGCRIYVRIDRMKGL